MRYEVIIYWSEADEAFLAEVPELPGCMADGATKAEALPHRTDREGVGGDGKVSGSCDSQASRPVDLRLSMAKAATSSVALPPVIVVAGDEMFLQNQHLAEIERGLFGGEDPGMGLVRLDPAAMGPNAMAVILDEARDGVDVFAAQDGGGVAGGCAAEEGG